MSALLEGLSLCGLLLATLLPWLCGVSLLRLLLGPLPVAMLVGHGYLLGQLLIILLLLLWSALGLSLSWEPLAGSLAAFGALLMFLSVRRHGAPCLRRPVLGPRDVLWLLPLAGFVYLRGGVLVEELALRPVFPWDAWMNWVPRAEVWFQHAALTPFGGPEQWLAAPADSERYTLGNAPAGHYPPGVPLLLLWQMLGAGTSDHTLLFVPWLCLALALAMALWGHLRAAGLSRLLCALALYMLLSMPMLHTHVALAGYADIWLGAAFTLGALALAQWQADGRAIWGLPTALMAVLCTLFKNPGLGYALLLGMGLLLLAWRPPRHWLAIVTLLALLLLMAGLLAGLHPDWVAQINARPSIELPGQLPTLKLRLTPLLPHIGHAFYVMDNWHLLAVLTPAALLACLCWRGPTGCYDMALLQLIAGTAMLIAVFAFTQYSSGVEQGTTFHRVFLYVAPLAVFVSFARLAPLLDPPAVVKR